MSSGTVWSTGRIAVGLLLLVGAVTEQVYAVPRSIAEAAAAVHRAVDAKGGLLVHLGCEDGRLIAAQRVSERWLVHGLDEDAARVDAARRAIEALGAYGPVSVDQCSGKRLPYVDNSVNVVVLSPSWRGNRELTAPDREEIMRVLVPGGTAVTMGQEMTQTFTKPRSDAIDEWTHYLHNPANNAVARDTVVGPPKHMQWVGGPRWARHHDRMASLSALVSARGKLFYIFDQGPTAAILLPPEWTLIARDAFNGVVLWKRTIPSWHPHLWPMKSGFAQLPRRLIAVADRVYVTLGFEEPLSCLDALTGQTLRTYEDTRSVEEVLFSDGVLFVLANSSASVHRSFEAVEKQNMWDAMRRAAGGWAWDGRERRLMAVEANTGKTLWDTPQRVVPLSLAVSGDGVFFHNGETVVCLGRSTGNLRWEAVESPGISFPKKHFTGSRARGAEVWDVSAGKTAFIPSSFAPTLVVHDDIVLFAGGDEMVAAFAAATGKALWREEHLPSGHFSPQDLFVIDDLVWSGAIALPERFHSGAFVGRDLRTGEVRREIPCDTDVYFMHHRCHRSKATERYFIPSRTGTEFIGLEDKHWHVHHWVRGGCVYGIMPCNGLLYAPPHSCACYMLSKLNGFNALAASRRAPLPPADPPEAKLQLGPAHGVPFQKTTSVKSEDWPTYRRDGMRSGFTPTAVSAELKITWQRDFAGTLSAATIAQGRVFVSRVEAHTLVALDAASGDVLWQYIAGGRVDSPPTVYRGMVFFGCADGRIYCLRASDGALVWRYRVGPREERLVARGQLESVWPLHGSVLIQGDALYGVAGRSMFLDGGLRLVRLDPSSGRCLFERVLDGTDPASGESLQTHIKGHQMPVALPDILSSDGKHLFMRTQVFDLDGRRTEVAPLSANVTVAAAVQSGEGMRVFSPIGFLDGSWWHRAYWVFGRRFATGAGGYPQAGKFAPAGRLLVHNDTGVYGFGRKPAYFRWTTPLEYRLFAAERRLRATEIMVGRGRKGQPRPRIPATAPVIRWSESIPLQVRGLVLAGDLLFAAGPPDLVDEEKAFRRLSEEGVQKTLARQSAALRGAEGGVLRVVSTSDGKTQAAYALESPPVWDGMSAANGRLYTSTMDGRLLCLGRMGQALPRAPVVEETFENPSLVGHWTFDEGKGRVARDSSERCNDATVRATWVDGKFGAAVLLKGDGDRVEIPGTECLNITDEITLMAWIRPEDQTEKIPMIVVKAGDQGKYILRLDTQRRLVALFWRDGDRVAVITSDEVVSKEWHHVAVTYAPLGSEKLRLYLDGEIVEEQTASANWGNPAGGAVTLSGRKNQALKGAIDEVRIYSRELSPTEVSEIAKAE